MQWENEFVDLEGEKFKTKSRFDGFTGCVSYEYEGSQKDDIWIDVPYYGENITWSYRNKHSLREVPDWFQKYYYIAKKKILEREKKREEVNRGLTEYLKRYNDKDCVVKITALDEEHMGRIMVFDKNKKQTFILDIVKRNENLFFTLEIEGIFDEKETGKLEYLIDYIAKWFEQISKHRIDIVCGNLTVKKEIWECV